MIVVIVFAVAFILLGWSLWNANRHRETNDKIYDDEIKRRKRNV